MNKIPVVDNSKCVKCNACIATCPVNAITQALNTVCPKCIKYCISFTVSCQPEYIAFDYSKCTSCGLCLKGCASHAIAWSKEQIT